MLIAAPEYAGAIAGVMKNALDWIVGSGDLYGKPGRYQLDHKVYGRPGLACPGCGQPVQRVRMGARSAFVCARCQR